VHEDLNYVNFTSQRKCVQISNYVFFSLLNHIFLFSYVNTISSICIMEQGIDIYDLITTKLNAIILIM